VTSSLLSSICGMISRFFNSSRDVLCCTCSLLRDLTIRSPFFNLSAFRQEKGDFGENNSSADHSLGIVTTALIQIPLLPPYSSIGPFSTRSSPNIPSLFPPSPSPPESPISSSQHTGGIEISLGIRHEYAKSGSVRIMKNKFAHM